MKEFLTLLGFIVAGILLMSLPSCGSIDTTDYRCTITYSLGEGEFTETSTISMNADIVPAYVCGPGMLKIVGVSNGYSGTYKTVYSGSITPTVKDFKYTTVRKYKTSRFDGHELKSRKK